MPKSDTSPGAREAPSSSASAASAAGPRLVDRWSASATKRVLTVHGPLHRLPLVIAWLTAIEGVVRRRTDVRGGGNLADYFDLIAGAGGGALVAALLAEGRSCSEVEWHCSALESAAVAKGTPLAQLTTNLFSDRWLRTPLASLFGAAGSFQARTWNTGVCLHAFRLDREEPCAFHNHPEGGFPGSLADALEACLAFPPHPLPVLSIPDSPATPPEELTGGTPEELLQMMAPRSTEGVFADARLAMAGGAAWLTWVAATAPIYPFRWANGADRLLMVSVGGGFWTSRETVGEALQRNVLQQAARLPEMLLRDALFEERWLVEGLARTATPRLPEPGAESDAEDQWFREPALTWLDYDLELDAGPLSALGVTPDEATLLRLRQPGSTADLQRLKDLGDRSAAAQIREEHFPPHFDLGSAPTGRRETQTGPQKKK